MDRTESVRTETTPPDVVTFDAPPKQQRAVVALHYLEHRPLDEIADTLEISASTARVHLHRATVTLRTRLVDPANPADPADTDEEAMP